MYLLEGYGPVLIFGNLHAAAVPFAGAGGIVGVIDQRVAREDDTAVGERQRPVAWEYADREIDRLGPCPAVFARDGEQRRLYPFVRNAVVVVFRVVERQLAADYGDAARREYLGLSELALARREYDPWFAPVGEVFRGGEHDPLAALVFAFGSVREDGVKGAFEKGDGRVVRVGPCTDRVVDYALLRIQLRDFGLWVVIVGE